MAIADAGRANKGTAGATSSARAEDEYTVVARRYRPRQFADLIGQEHVSQALTNAFASNRVAHAYLFTGARGVGKTSCARILAKALNCVQGPTATPCDECDICKSIAAGDDVDVVEIDAASNTGVDNIRELRANVGFRPQRARYKVYIIDEVHMLSTSAFNALLKTLEEPPAHVKFIFATTEVNKIPITILSRCQRFDFSHIGPAKVFETLKHIAVKEGLEADDDALRLISRRAAGSMRDAQTLLDQLLGSAQGRLTAAAVHSLLGTAGDDRIGDLADAILAGDASKGMQLVAEAADRGLQLGELGDQLIDYWRGLMLVAVAGTEARDLPGTPALHDKIRAHAAGRNLDQILMGIDILTTAKARMRGSPHAQVLLEVAVVRLSRLDELLSVAQLAQWLDSDEPAPAKPAQSKPVAAPEPSKKNFLNGSSPPNGIPQQVPTGPTPLTEANLDAIWGQVRQEIGPIRGAQLKQAGTPAITGPYSLVLRFPAVYTSAYDACATEPSQETIRATLKRITGHDWKIRLELSAETAAVNGPAPVASVRQRKQELLQLPLFKKINDLFGTGPQAWAVEDGFDPTAASNLPQPAPAAPDEE